MKRHETLHLGSPKPRHLSHSRSYRRLSSTSRAKLNGPQGGSDGSVSTKPPHIEPVDPSIFPQSPLSDHTDASGAVADYFAPFVADPAAHDLGTELGDLGNLDPFHMSSTNWLPPAQPSHPSLDPFNVLWDLNQNWEQSNPTPTIPEASPVLQPMTLPPNAGLNPTTPDALFNSPMHSQLRRATSADALGCDSPRSFSSIDSSDRSSQAPSGEFYIDGGASRLPKGRKRRTSVNSTHSISPGYGSHTSRLTLVSNNLDNHQRHPISFVNSYNYGIMTEVFMQTCTQTQQSFQAFEEDNFLPQLIIDDLVSLAVEHFLPTVSFIHKPKLQSQASSWILYLALATIGTHYELNILDERVFSMNEFLRRALAWVEVGPL